MSLARSWGQKLEHADQERLVANVKCEHALSLSDENTEKAPRLMRAGNMFFTLFKKSRKNADLNKAITIDETAVRLTPDDLQCTPEGHTDKPA